MITKVLSGTTVGLESIPVEVEVDIALKHLPSLKIVGLPGKAVEEAKERVRAAIKNSGAEFPSRKRITINLTPADLPKEGPAYDLPIALGILIAHGQFDVDLSNSLVFGELSLDGSLRHTNGVLPLTLLAKQLKAKQVFLPKVNAKEAAILKGIKIIPVTSLIGLFHHFNKTKLIKPQSHIPFSQLKSPLWSTEFDMADIYGQEQAKRALEIAAAGGHNVLMTGPPGAGKTMLARTLPSILTDLTENEALEITKIYSISGNLASGQSVIKKRLFRSPHHTTSRIGLIGGGTKPMPGEISMAHRGVLFLDEFPEFPRSVLEALRQPMEDGVISISRAAGTITFPAKFLLVAAANPCPCGFLGSTKKHCTCLPGNVARYKKRISGPILDRIDIHLTVPEVEIKKLSEKIESGEKSKTIRERVQKARDKQIKRFSAQKLKIVCNAELSTKRIKKLCIIEKQASQLLQKAMATMNLSARSYFKVIKVSQTIADLAGEEKIASTHVAEALQYRPREETF